MGKHLSDDVVAEIKRLRLEEGLPVEEVASRLADKGVNASHVKRHANTVKAAKPAKKAARKVLGAKKRAKTAPVAGEAPDLRGLVDLLITECGAYTAYVFKQARREIIKHIAATRAKRIEAGEDVPVLDIEDKAA